MTTHRADQMNLLTMVLLVIVFFPVPPALCADWPTFQGNSHHTGFNSAEKSLLPPLRARWFHELGGQLFQATVFDRYVVVTPWLTGPNWREGQLWCFDLETGDSLWWGTFGNVWQISQTTYAEGKLFVQADSPVYGLAALQPESGELIWLSYYRSQYTMPYAPVVDSGQVFMTGNMYGGMHVFTADSGRFLWKVQLVQESSWAPAVYGDTVYTYIVGAYVGLHAQTGQQLWWERPYDPQAGALLSGEQGGEQGNAPVIDTVADVVILTDDAYLLAMDLSDRSLLWVHHPGGLYKTTPVVCDSVVYAIHAGVLKAYAARTGDSLWAFTCPESFYESEAPPPVVANGHIYVSSPERVYAVNLATHQQVWSTNLVAGYLAVGNGRLIVSGKNGLVMCFGSAPVGVEDEDEPVLPQGYVLCQNQPNPFNPSTEISFSVPVAGRVRIEILNSLGQVVETVADRRFSAGSHTVSWHGSGCASGVYLYRMTAGEFVDTKKMVLVK